jgi:hypothetical protein
MDTLSFDLIRLIASHLSYSEVINFLSTNKRLLSELKNNAFWRHYVQSQCPSLFHLRPFQEKKQGWREMCTTDIYRVRIRSYISGTWHRSKCFLPIVYQEDLLLKCITGDVYISLFGRFFRIDLDFDKIISTYIKEDVLEILYLNKGQLWLYQALTRNLKCRDYHLIERSFDLDIIDVGYVQVHDVYHMVLAREGNIITYLSLAFPKPCEIDRAPRVIEVVLDIQVPARISTIAIDVFRPQAVEEKVCFSICIVTSSQWLYHYYHEDEKTRLMTKHSNILLVINYNRRMVILDNKGNIFIVTSSHLYRNQGTCEYVLRQGRYYVKQTNNRFYTLRNYISYQTRCSYQVTIPTTLAKLEFYRSGASNK